MSDMFYNCTALTSLDLSSFDTNSVTNMGGLFSDCSSLTSIDLSTFNTEKANIMWSMFCNCTNLKTIYVTNGKWSTTQAHTNNMFTGCGTSSVTYK